MIILLDLNFTLIDNSDEKLTPFTRQIENEKYSLRLIEKIKDHTVVLITARPAVHREATLKSIEEKTGWKPQYAYFNEWYFFPAACKKRIMESYVFPTLGHDLSSYLAIESNPRTRVMYENLGVKAITKDIALKKSTKL